jgi:hypothetical protein
MKIKMCGVSGKPGKNNILYAVKNMFYELFCDLKDI